MKIFFIIFIFVIKLYSETDIIKVDEIKSGMRGRCRTVFEGIKIEDIEVEIIGVLKNARAGSDLILAKLLGERIKDTGVIAGMSGSPVYISNKIAGAVAFSWAFSKEPITAITPIENMIELSKRKFITNLYNFEPNLIEEKDNNNLNFLPIKSPLVFSGVSENSINLFKKDFEKFGFIPMAGPGIDNLQTNIEKFEPGSPVGVNIITGDLNLTAIGTVTYVKDDTILIFGHPLFFSGASDIPLSYAYIHTVVPSLYHSFKIGSPTKIAGRIYQDELFGLAGKLNQFSKMIPLNLEINYAGNYKNYNFNIIKSYTLLPQFIGLCIMRGIESIAGLLQKNTLNFKFEIFFDNNKKINLNDTIPGITLTESLNSGMLFMLNPLSQIIVNKFENLNIEKMKIKLDIVPTIKVFEIKNILVDKTEYEAGEIVNAKILLKAYQGEKIYKEMKFKLPKNLKPGNFILVASSAKEAQYIDFILSPAKYNPYNLDQLIDIFNNLSKNNELALWSIIRERGLVMDGQIFERIPSSYYFIIQDSIDKRANPVLTMLSEKLDLDYVLIGNAMYSIKIVDSVKEIKKENRK